MARPQKIGLDYFPLDVYVDQDDKVAIIEAKYGLLGFGVIIKLLMKIYSEGYYYKWSEKEQILFSKRVNVDINTVNNIINDCIKWGMFEAKLFKKYEILTSNGIQVRYFEAITRRKTVEVVQEYLLLKNGALKSCTNLIIVPINEVNVDINEVNDNISTQSKVKNSKEYKDTVQPKEVERFFEEVWKIYPSKRGKGKISDTKKKTIYKLGDEFKRCIQRYEADTTTRKADKFGDLQYQNGSTFFNSGYVDYLDKNYIEIVGQDTKLTYGSDQLI